MSKASFTIAAFLTAEALVGVAPLMDAAEPRNEALVPGAGPAVEVVNAIVEDRAGFIWIASREGLILFDGYSSTVFEHDVSDPTSLSDNTARNVFEDREGRLWVGTNTGGLNLFDRATSSFTSFRHDSSNPRSISHDSVYAVAQDRAGGLWVGTQGGLDRFDPEAGVFERLAIGPQGLSAAYVVALLAGSDGSIWVATAGGGLNRLDPETRRITVLRHDPGDAASISSDYVFSVAEAPDRSIWIATGEGIDRIDPATGAVRRHPIRKLTGEGAEVVTWLSFGPDATLWAGTLDSGLWSLPTGATAFRPVPYRGALDAPQVARIIAVLAGRDGSVWVGTWGGGLARVPRTLRNSIVVEDRGVGDAGASSDIESVLADTAGQLWSGDTRCRVVRRSPDGTSRSYQLGENAPISLDESRRGMIYAGTTGQFYEIDPSATDVRRAVRRLSPPDERGWGWVWDSIEDREGRRWAASGLGLIRRRDDGSFERILHDAKNPASLSDDYVLSLLEDRSGTLWVGTRSAGLNALLPGGAGFQRYLPSASDPHSLSHHTVTALLEDRNGTIWVGTGAGGFNRVERDERGGISFRRYGERDGLVDDNVSSLAEDADGTLWIGTRRGLSRFDPVSGAFASFGVEDGLPSAEFAIGAASAGRDAIYFGTHRGIVAARRGTPFPRAKASPTVVRAIRTLSGKPASNAPAWAAEAVAVDHGEALSIEIAVLDFGDRRRHRYAYRLEGLSDDWVELGSHREVTFTHLDPRTYTLRVKGRNDQGVWSEAPVALAIRIVPPFWMTGWFRFLAGASVVSGALAIHRLRTSSLQRRNRELLVLKAQRETALDEARSSQNALNLAYGRLRGLTRGLEAAKEDERKRIARELHDEMGQALTTAKLNLQLLPGTIVPEERERRVSDAIGLLDRLIGHVRALSLDLRPPLLDELGLSPALRGYLEAQARRSGLVIDLAADSVPPGLPSEIEIAAFRVAQEAVTNVLRHAQARRVSVEVRYDPGWLDVRVVDDGRGFDVAETLDHAAGRHLGLLGMRERVDSLGGSVTIESTPGHGTAIRAHLPWGSGATS